MRFVCHPPRTVPVGAAFVMLAVFFLPGCEVWAAASPAAQSWVDEGLEVSKTRPNSDEEAACYRRAIEVDPNHSSAHFNLAFVLDSQASESWRGAETAWADLDKLYEALEHYAASVGSNPGREDAYANSVRITRLLMDTPTKRPPDLQTLRSHLRTCREAAARADGAPAIRSQEKAMDGLILTLEKRISELKDAMPRDKLVSASEITRGLTTRFTRGQSPYRGPRVPLMIQFDLNKDTIRPDSAAQLREVAEALKNESLAGRKILIEGHTDSQGASEYNAGLSMRRSASVKRYLVEKFGIAESRFQTQGYGENRPLVPNDTDDHRAMNRRIEFVNGGELDSYQEKVGQRKRSEAVDRYDLLY